MASGNSETHITDCGWEMYNSICEKRFTRIDTTLGKIYARIEGNGTEGMHARLIRVEEKAEAAREAARSRESWAQRLITPVVAAVVVAIIMVAAQHLSRADTNGPAEQNRPSTTRP